MIHIEAFTNILRSKRIKGEFSPDNKLLPTANQSPVPRGLSISACEEGLPERPQKRAASSLSWGHLVDTLGFFSSHLFTSAWGTTNT